MNWVRKAALVSLIAVAPSACLYSFHGGGLPGDIRTLSIQQFDNRTAQVDVPQLLLRGLQAELPSALGVRLVGGDAAAAVVQGTITGYVERVSQFTTGVAGTTPTVQQREVAVSAHIEIRDVVRDRILWRGDVQETGRYNPASGQTEQVGRDAAIKLIVRRVVDGAQSQW